MDRRWDGVLPLLMPLPSTRLLNLITPLAPDLGPCSKPGRNEFAPPTSARPTTLAFSNPSPSPPVVVGVSCEVTRARLSVTPNSTFPAPFLVSASRAARRYDAADFLALSIVDTPVTRHARPLSILHPGAGRLHRPCLAAPSCCLLATAAWGAGARFQSAPSIDFSGFHGIVAILYRRRDLSFVLWEDVFDAGPSLSGERRPERGGKGRGRGRPRQARHSTCRAPGSVCGPRLSSPSPCHGRLYRSRRRR